MQFQCVSRTHVGLKRQINEDSVFVASERGLWAVADGMGGHDAGEVASAMVRDALQALPECGSLDELLREAIAALQQANSRLIALARSEAREKTIGTTVAGLAIADGEFRCFWAGDSRAYRIRDRQISRLSRDHSLVQDLVDAGMLAPEEAEGHENANVITRAVGVRESVEVDTVSGNVLSGDQYLLASDGLTRVVGDNELLAELVRSEADAAADNLVEIVLARGAPDNVSLVLIRVE